MKGCERMKKFIAILLIITSLAIFSACDKLNNLQKPKTTEEISKPTDILPTEDVLLTPTPELTAMLTSIPVVTETATVTETPIATETPITSPSATATESPKATATPTAAQKQTPTPTTQSTQKVTPSPTPAPTPVPTPVPTPPPTPIPTPTPTQPPSDGVVTNKMLKDIETGFLKLVNNERARVGLSKLTINSYLDSYAQTRSKEITTYFEHTRPDGSEFHSGMDQSKYNYSTLGENICMTSHVGTGTITDFTGSDAQIEAVYANMYKLFRNSPGHYANMIDGDFEHCGIGITYKIEKGIPMFYCAHIFGADQ